MASLGSPRSSSFRIFPEEARLDYSQALSLVIHSVFRTGLSRPAVGGQRRSGGDVYEVINAGGSLDIGSEGGHARVAPQHLGDTFVAVQVPRLAMAIPDRRHGGQNEQQAQVRRVLDPSGSRLEQHDRAARRRGAPTSPTSPSEDRSGAARRIAVYLEVTPKQAFASALDWPGWCRASRDEGAALEALAGYARRYTPVADHAEVSFPDKVGLRRRRAGARRACDLIRCTRMPPPVPASDCRSRSGDGDRRRSEGAWPGWPPPSGRSSTRSPSWKSPPRSRPPRANGGCFCPVSST